MRAKCARLTAIGLSLLLSVEITMADADELWVEQRKMDYVITTVAVVSIGGELLLYVMLAWGFSNMN